MTTWQLSQETAAQTVALPCACARRTSLLACCGAALCVAQQSRQSKAKLRRKHLRLACRDAPAASVCDVENDVHCALPHVAWQSGCSYASADGEFDQLPHDYNAGTFFGESVDRMRYTGLHLAVVTSQPWERTSARHVDNSAVRLCELMDYANKQLCCVLALRESQFPFKRGSVVLGLA